MDEKLVEYAVNSGITVTAWEFKEPVRALYLNMPGCTPIIGYSPVLEKSTSLFRTIFAEELGHHFTSSGNGLAHKYLSYRDRLSISKTEYRAMRWGALYLIPLDEFIKAIAEGLREVWELAEHFDVTEEFIKFRISLPDYQHFLSETAGRRFCD